MVKMSFDELSRAILKYDAKSFLKQGSIVMLRSIFKEKEELLKPTTNSAMDAMMVSRMSNLCARLASWGMVAIMNDLPLQLMVRDASECAKYYKIPLQYQ